MNEEIILNSRKKLVVLLLIYLSIALAFIGTAFFKMYSMKQGKTLDLSELVSEDNVKEKQNVEFNIDNIPILIERDSEKDDKLYYVKDVNNNTYLISLSEETYKKIFKNYNVMTKKLNNTYRLKGITHKIDEQLKNIVLSDKNNLFNNELNADNFSEYFGNFYIKENYVSKRELTFYKILAVIGVFFIVLALIHVVPAIIKVSKGEFGIFDEKKMMQALEKYLPVGETITEGICSIGIQSEIKQVFGKCICVEGRIIPDESSTALQVKKSKFAKFYVYVGISQNCLILSECESYKHYYEFNYIADAREIDVEKVSNDILLEDIGNCFMLGEIKSCEIKNARNGDIYCSITMKNGSFLKLRIPKHGGLGMPHHTEYRDAIISKIKKNCC